jgi:hypothetical protein
MGLVTEVEIEQGAPTLWDTTTMRSSSSGEVKFLMVPRTARSVWRRGAQIISWDIGKSEHFDDANQLVKVRK